MTDLSRQVDLRLSAPGLDVTLNVSLPAGVGALLENMLSGWVMAPSDAVPTPDIVVRRGDRYALISPHYTSERDHSDLIACLNECAVAIGYAVRNHLPHLDLIHGAGFAEAGRTTVLFGQRKAGKSVFISRKAASGAQIFGDDLLLWDPGAKSFRALGIAPRLRRPVPPDIIDALDNRAFIAGASTCYLNRDFIDLAPAGSNLMPDRYAILNADRQLTTIRFYKVLQQVNAHRIP